MSVLRHRCVRARVFPIGKFRLVPRRSTLQRFMHVLIPCHCFPRVAWPFLPPIVFLRCLAGDYKYVEGGHRSIHQSCRVDRQVVDAGEDTVEVVVFVGDM